MHNLQSEDIGKVKQAVLVMLDNKGADKANESTIVGYLTDLRDRELAALACCRIIDELKAAGKLGVVEGAKGRYDRTTGAKRLCIRQHTEAYPDYPTKLTLITEKAGPTLHGWETKKQVDKVEQATTRLVKLIDCTAAEAESLQYTIQILLDQRKQAARQEKAGQLKTKMAERQKLADWDEAIAEDIRRKLAEVTVTARQLAEEKGYKGKQADAFVAAYLMVANG